MTEETGRVGKGAERRAHALVGTLRFAHPTKSDL
jgi:hypothetical protein